MSRPAERDSETLWLPLLRDLSGLSQDSAVWKNADSGLAGTGDVDFVTPRSNWPAVEEAFRSWAEDSDLGPVIPCRHLPDTAFLVAVDRARGDFLQLDVRSRMTFRGGTVFVPQELGNCFEHDVRGFRRLRPGSEGLLKLVISGIAPGGRPKQRTLIKEGVVPLLSSDPQGVRVAADLCGRVKKAAFSGAEALRVGRWDRRAMATVEAWYVIKGLMRPSTAWGRIGARRARARCELIQTSVKRSRRIPGAVDDWLSRVERDHSIVSVLPLQEGRG